MFQIAPEQVKSRIEEQKRFVRKSAALLERFERKIGGLGGMESMEEAALILRGPCRRLEEQVRQAEELALALERVRQRCEDCEYAVLNRAENEWQPRREAGFVCEALLGLPEGWENLLEFDTAWEEEG